MFDSRFYILLWSYSVNVSEPLSLNERLFTNGTKWASCVTLFFSEMIGFSHYSKPKYLSHNIYFYPDLNLPQQNITSSKILVKVRNIAFILVFFVPVLLALFHYKKRSSYFTTTSLLKHKLISAWTQHIYKFNRLVRFHHTPITNKI